MRPKSMDLESNRLREEELNRLLAAQTVLPQISQQMHESIMHQVACAQRNSEKSPTFRAPWLPKFACAMIATALLTAGFWMNHHRGVRTAPLAALQPTPTQIDPGLSAQLQATWSFLGEFGTNAPFVLTRPLSSQLDRWSNDLHKTTELLLASFP